MSRLLEQVREAVWTSHDNLRTEEAYLRWTLQYILFRDRRYHAAPGKSQTSTPTIAVEDTTVMEL